MRLPDVQKPPSIASVSSSQFTRCVSRCEPCSCQPDIAERRSHDYNCSLMDSAYAYAAATARSEHAASVPRVNHRLSVATSCSSVASLGPPTPYDIYDDPFAGPDGWTPGAEGPVEDNVSEKSSNSSIGGVVNVLRVMEQGGGQAMLEANAHWSASYRDALDGPLLPGGAFQKSYASSLRSDLSDASSEYGWFLDLDIATPRAERPQSLPIYRFFTEHYWTLD
ncbi:hypothetical protein BD626DRAFT_5844 [Schizophyllum amplum]|uniref:Uncharacterized protein n=1 Tax=Schizophyllum amplum TaxID=97359 RepID=A0A550CWE7_9AGAR|nr:hypothetical protein BD626DRAFT_5844 [Auriculariopsis ampla]